jgi:hypothetical protein
MFEFGRDLNIGGKLARGLKSDPRRGGWSCDITGLVSSESQRNLSELNYKESEGTLFEATARRDLNSL